jgi:hypothetical protein
MITRRAGIDVNFPAEYKNLNIILADLYAIIHL